MPHETLLGCYRCGYPSAATAGVTLIELLVVLAILSTLAAVAVPKVQTYANKARVMRAITDIQRISNEISAYRVDTGALPNSLDEIGHGSHRDPWGRPYQYLNIETVKGKGKLRKDKFLVPLNSDYDLYSLGKDGESQAPLTAKASRDDIIRANDGGYIGLASRY